jgi:hypothetical protein
LSGTEDLGKSFLVFTLADFLNLLALTLGVFVITRVLDRRRAHEEHFKDLLLRFVDRYEETTSEALAALTAAKGRQLNLQSDEDRVVIVAAKKVAQRWDDIKVTLKKYNKSLAESKEVSEVEREFERLRSYVTGDVIQEPIDAGVITTADNQHRKLMERLLELRIRIMSE